MNNGKKIRNIRWRYVILSTIVFMVFLIAVLPRVSAYTESLLGEVESPDTSIYYSSDELYHIAESYGESGRDTYIRLRWTFDLIWPLVYTFFLISWILALSEYSLKVKRRKYLIVFPITGMGFDILENIGATIVMLRYPQTSNIIATLTPFMTLLKWTSISISFALVVVLAIIGIFNGVRKLKDRK